MTLTPLQSLAADFPGPKFHTNCSSDVQKTLSPPWSNQHVLVAGGFKNDTNFSSIRSTRLSFCLALQFVFKSESKSQFIVVEIWNHAQILNFVTFMPNFYLRLISNLWWNLSIKKCIKKKIWNQTDLWPVSGTERGKQKRRWFWYIQATKTQSFEKSMHF